MELDEETYLAHYGTPRRSGRYPWGSGGNVSANSQDFLDRIKELRSQGMSDTEIAKGWGMSTTDYRAAKSIAKNEIKAANVAMALRLKEKRYSNVAIGERMGVPESTVRTWLAPGAAAKADIIQTTASLLRKEVDKQGMIDVGAGTENYLNVSPERLKVALSVLEQQGYNVHSGIKVQQLGTGKETTLKVLTKPNISWTDVAQNKDQIRLFQEKLDETGNSQLGIKPPLSINPNRVAVKYGSEGGAKAEGVMYVRPGVEDVSLGNSRYAQVRVKVGETHYLKGMAMYKDDLPDGIDIMFNTTKESTGNKLDALKPLKDDPDNPFGAVIRSQVTKPDPSDPTGARRINTSVMNKLSEEGDWTTWSKTIASQVLSKQSPVLAKEQLDMAYERKKNEFDEISRLTNPTVKRKLLMELADSADRSSYQLKAANLPRQAWHVILPVDSLKPNEIYAPNYNNGEKVALIRYPHGGTFEIPELVVNNRNRSASKLLGSARDAVGIHSSVAERLSGADFDGDTVLVIPNNNRKINHTNALEGLKDFDPKTSYPKYPGMKVMSDTQKQMGMVSNLITDMTLQKASRSEIARAVRHSMVVIDAEKHELNYKQSEKDNGIKELRAKYQLKPDGGTGANTLISRAKGQVRVPDFKERPMSEGGPIDRRTGEKVYVPTGKKTSSGAPVNVKKKALELESDAHVLSSGTKMERLYADHSNRLKALANRARLDSINTPRSSWSTSAKTVYSKEIDELDAALSLAKSSAPLERRAQLLANSNVKAKKQANPKMDPDMERRVKFQALEEARKRTGAGKTRIEITDRQWEAIQHGAISDTRLSEILKHANMERVKELATPRTKKLMSASKTRRAQSMLALGYTRAEVAAQLGVSLSTLDEATVGDGS